MKMVKGVKKKKDFTVQKLDKACLCNTPYKNLFKNHTQSGLNGSISVKFKCSCCKLVYVNFAANGRYLACVKVKSLGEYDPRTGRYASPVTQLILYDGVSQTCCDNLESNSAGLRPNHVRAETEHGCGFCADLNLTASINLNLIEVYSVQMSNDELQFAVYGFGFNDMPRKPSISVYEIHLDKQNGTSLSQKTKLIFENSGILSAMMTACKFFPTDSNVLVTSICDDYHTMRKCNYLDFWNSKSSLHFARLSLTEKAPKFQGYVTSMSFSSDGLLLAMTSSTRHTQLLLYSSQTHEFGPVFCQQDYFLQEHEHFPAHSTFATDLYELFICSSPGDLLRLAIDPKSLTVAHVISHTMVFDALPQPEIGIAQQTNAALGFMYCKATCKCVIRSKRGLHFFDADRNTVEKTIPFQNKEPNHDDNNIDSDSHSWMAMSKTGQELAVVSSSELLIYLRQNSDMSLKNLCRQYIIQLVPEDKIVQVSLPKTLQSYLLYSSN